jgi:hypothetical protein
MITEDVTATLVRMLRHGLAAAALALGMLVTAPGAIAAPCAGFTDVPDTSGFCDEVEWLKNRGITTGCTSATLYCPNDPVSRIAMAAFMNRLGTALTPKHYRVDTSPGAVDLDTSPVVCQTTDIPMPDYPRRAFVDLYFGGTAPADVDFAVDLAMSTDLGLTWTNLNANTNRGSVLANKWSGVSDIGYADLDAGKTVRFGARTTRGGIAGGVDLTNSHCQMRVLVHSRTGTASPY